MSKIFSAPNNATKPVKPVILRREGKAWVVACDNCGIEFRAYVNNRRYCSKKCYRPTIQNRLYIRSKRNPITNCLEWQGFRDRDGYGMVGTVEVRDGKNHYQSRRTHRVAWVAFVGPIPEGMQVCHHCDNPCCIEVTHLFLGTPKDNNHDMIAKGRQVPPRGELAGSSKLTKHEVISIRVMHTSGKFTQRDIAACYSVGFKAINKIVHRQRWKHV